MATHPGRADSPNATQSLLSTGSSIDPPALPKLEIFNSVRHGCIFRIASSHLQPVQCNAMRNFPFLLK